MQGVAKQPALSDILDSMSRGPKESFPVFKSRFNQISNALNQRCGATILCSKFARAIKRNTGNYYDDCITSATAATDQTDFDVFSALLVRLCTQKRSREASNSAHSSEVAALTAKIEALTAAVKSGGTQNRGDKRGSHDSRGQRDGSRSTPNDQRNRRDPRDQRNERG